MARLIRKFVRRGGKSKAADSKTIRKFRRKSLPDLVHKLEWDASYDYKAERDRRLENDPRFLRRIEQARNSLRAGRRIRLEDAETE